jgi:hypothetical protein
MDERPRISTAFAPKANRAGVMVDWKRTPITVTEGARETDFWRQAAGEIASGLNNHWERLTHAAPGRRSFGRDSALSLRDRVESLANNQRDSSTRSQIIGLRHYLSELEDDALVNPTIVRPLVQALERNRNSR